VLSVGAHVALFAALSLGFIAAAKPLEVTSQPIEVTLTDQVALVSGAPDPSPEPPAARKSPVEAPVTPDSAPAPADPAPPTKAPPTPPKDAIPDPSARRRPDKPAPTQQANAKPGQRPATPSGRLDGLDLTAPSDRPSTSTSTKAQAATMTPAAAQNIGSAILRQIQPCANRQVNPGPGANRIRVKVQLHLNRDGTLIDRPTVIGTPQGVDEDNERYVARVKDLAIATFMGCSPLRGLPVELWDVQRGWRNFIMNYKLPD
jgi:outer membrane biosynthesis protein TonB